MGDSEAINEKLFCIDRAKQGRAACKKCKEKCAVGELRIAKLVPSPYGAGKMKSWHHVDCMFEQFLKQRPATNRIESLDDIDGYDILSEDDQKFIFNKIYESEKQFAEKHGLTIPDKKKFVITKKETKNDSPPSKNDTSPNNPKIKNANKTFSKDPTKSLSRDFLFKEFRRLVADITNENSYLKKSKIVENMFKNGSSGNGFMGDVKLWCHLLLPGVVKRIYNLQSKQLVKLFSKIFHVSQTPMLEHLKEGDVSETIHIFFEQNTRVKPPKKSTLTVNDVDTFLEELSKLSKEEEQMQHFKQILPKCTTGDLKVIIRLIKHDLRMNAGAKHILDGIHSDAYEAYQSSRDLNVVIDRCLKNSTSTTSSNIEAGITLLTPVLPMLAQACKSVEQAMKKCPNGIYSEIKYDGERVQVHKKGTEFKYFSRSLKPVLTHKIEHFKKYIPKAFPHADDLILDSEILMVDTATGKPLPFGTLGVHKKSEFKEATVCLFIFDCIYYNGEDISKKPIKLRKEILRDKMIEIPNRIVFSEMQEIRKAEDLSDMIKRVLKQGLEGLVLKDAMSIYEPGKRHWLKIKKDYLFEGAMADSADLIVLGAWFGTGKKGGIMSTFLMGCYDNTQDVFVTVTKVHTGHDDETLDRLQKELEMIKINCDYDKVPSWLKCSKIMTPDFVAKDPKKQPVWQIIGAEFTQHEVHTADGISIRFPRVTRIRDDKNWETATNLTELHNLFDESKHNMDNLFDKEKMSISSESHDSKTKEVEMLESNLEETKKLTKAKRKNDLEIDNSSSKRMKRTVEKVELINPIPNLFKSTSLFVFDEIDTELKKWLRYFVAYGGRILDKNYENATHVLHAKEETNKICDECPKNARHIQAGWIKETIIKQCLQDTIAFTVKLLSNDSEEVEI